MSNDKPLPSSPLRLTIAERGALEGATLKNQLAQKMSQEALTLSEQVLEEAENRLGLEPGELANNYLIDMRTGKITKNNTTGKDLASQSLPPGFNEQSKES